MVFSFEEDFLQALVFSFRFPTVKEDWVLVFSFSLLVELTDTLTSEPFFGEFRNWYLVLKISYSQRRLGIGIQF